MSTDAALLVIIVVRFKCPEKKILTMVDYTISTYNW